MGHIFRMFGQKENNIQVKVRRFTVENGGGSLMRWSCCVACGPEVLEKINCIMNTLHTRT